MKEKKKKTGLARLFEIAGERKGLLILAGILSAGSAACMLVPYWSVYEILSELLRNGSDWSQINGNLLIRWGWVAFAGLIGGLILLYAALMSSHFIRLARQSVRTYRTPAPGLPEQHLDRFDQENDGAKHRKNRKFHRPYDSRSGQCSSDRRIDVRHFLFAQRLAGSRLPDCHYREYISAVF